MAPSITIYVFSAVFFNGKWRYLCSSDAFFENDSWQKFYRITRKIIHKYFLEIILWRKIVIKCEQDTKGIALEKVKIFTGYKYIPMILLLVFFKKGNPLSFEQMNFGDKRYWNGHIKSYLGVTFSPLRVWGMEILPSEL